MRWGVPALAAFVLLVTLVGGPWRWLAAGVALAAVPLLWPSRRSEPQARAATLAHDGVLSFVAHELRTPLTALLGMADLLRDSQLSPDQRDMVDVMSRSARGLVDTITNVLDLAKLRAGKMALETRPFSVAACVEDCIDLLAPRAAERRLELAYLVDARVPARVGGDATRLRQVLLNLVGNALKFTETGEILVTVTCGARTGGRCELQFAVADSGPGIPPDRLEAIFDAFCHADPSTARRCDGTGLGLSISRQLVQLMGGRIWAESALGEGSTFRFTMPGEVVEAPPPCGERLVGPLAGRRVLVVDDRATMSRVLAVYMERWGIQVEVATDTCAAGAMLGVAGFDAVVIDEGMWTFHGSPLIAAIGRAPAASPVPLLCLTALTGRRPAESRPADGPSVRPAGLVTKPVKPARLYEALVRAVSGSATPRAPAAAPECREARADADALPRGGGEREASAHPEYADLRGLRVLVADDDADVRALLERVLAGVGVDALALATGALALEALKRWKADVVVLDGVMPGVDGFEVCRRLKADPTTMLIPVIMISGLDSDADRMRGIEVGVDGFMAKPFDRVELLARIRSLARMKRATEKLERAEAVLVAIARCIEGRDPHTLGHCERLSDYAARLGRRLGLDATAIDALRLGGMVHDIGKVSIPDAILLKPGPLDAAEWQAIWNHPVEGERICAGLSSFQHVLPIIRHHHEKLDGSGYPDGLRGEAIPITARVLQVVDVYDALTTRRPYKAAASPEQALAIMQQEVDRGWWDPVIFREFRHLVGEGLEREDGAAVAMAS